MSPWLRRAGSLAGVLLGPWLHSQPADPPPLAAQEIRQGYRNGYVMAKPKAERMSTVDEEESREGTKVSRRFPRFGGLRVVQAGPGESTAAAIARLRASGRYEFVEPDYVRRALSVPNDPDFSQQWALSNTGSNPTITGPGIPGADIHAVSAWNTRTDAATDSNGQPVVIAVVDSGALLNHEDLASNLWKNPQENQDGYVNDLNGIDATVPMGSPGSGNPLDTDGHGTHVSGIIAAVGNNGAEGSGVCWTARLMELKFIGSTGSGAISAEVACLDFALAHGAAVVNASFGSLQFSQTELTALQSLQKAGVIFVAAAGNAGESNDLSPAYPASYLLDNIVSVACSDNRDDTVFFTSYGSGSVDLYAPGYQIVSLYNNAANATATLSGTSMSTAMVTGAIALLRAQYPADTYRQRINRLLRAVDANPNFAGRVQTGGRLNLASALTSAPGANTPFNDSFASRSRLAGPLLKVRTSNAGASREPGEPTIAGDSGGASLWWEWTAPVSGTVTLTTAGSAYPTLLGVYAGNSLGSLAAVASSNASGTGAAAVSFPAQAGGVYEISVDGQGGASGLTALNLNYAYDSFASPVALTGASFTFTGSNVGASRESGEPRILGNGGGHSVWFAWTAPVSGPFQLSAYSHDFDPLLAVYTGNSPASLALVSANAGSVINSAALNPASLSSCTFSAAAGTTYYFTVDGNADTTSIGAGQFTLSLVDSAWQTAIGDSITTSPAVGVDGTVYVGGTDSVFYAFAPDGSTRWKTNAAGHFDTCSAALSPDGSAVYAGASDGGLYAFDAATGALLWKYSLASGAANSPAVAADGTIYVKDSTATLYAITPAGALQWSYPIPGISYSSASLAGDGTLYLGSDDGNLYALTASGALKWKFPAGSSIYTAPAIDSAGNLYFGTLGGTFDSLRPDGTLRWTYQAGNSISSSPALSPGGGTVYFGSYDRHLYALDTASGAVRWSYLTGGEIRASTPAIDGNGVVYVGSYDDILYAINPDGSLDRTYAAGDWIRSSPVIVPGALYFGSNDHKLYAAALAAGPAASPWPMAMGDAERFGRTLSDPPTIQTQPLAQAVQAGGSAAFTVSASGAASYQWFLNHAAIPGANGATLALANVGTEQAGSYTVLVTSSGGAYVLSNPAALAVSFNARLADISTLATAGAGANALFAGFVVAGSGSKQILVRGIGPALAAAPYDVPGTLPAPQLTLYDSGSQVIATDSGWGNSPVRGASPVATGVAAATPALMSGVGAFALPANSADSALAATTLPAGSYSAGVGSGIGSAGTALVEIYDADGGSPPARLVNISTRGTVGGSSGVLIAGFVVTGATAETVLLRGVGPGLAGFGVSGALASTQLALYDAQSNLLAANAGWSNRPTGGTASVAASPATSTLMNGVGAFALTANSGDSAMVATLPPGRYSVQVSGINGAAGIGLVEVYEVP